MRAEMGKFHCRCRKRQPHCTVNTTCISISYLPCLSYLERSLVTCKFTTQTGATSCVCPYLSHSFGHRFTNLRIQTEPHDHTVCVCVGSGQSSATYFTLNINGGALFALPDSSLMCCLTLTVTEINPAALPGCLHSYGGFMWQGMFFYLQAELMIFQCIKI